MKLKDIERASSLAFDLEKLEKANRSLGIDHDGDAACLSSTRAPGEKWAFIVSFEDTRMILTAKIEQIRDELRELGVELPEGGIG